MAAERGESAEGCEGFNPGMCRPLCIELPRDDGTAPIDPKGPKLVRILRMRDVPTAPRDYGFRIIDGATKSQAASELYISATVA